MHRFDEDNKIEKLEKTVERVLTQNNLQSVLYFSKIQKHWDIIVGAPLSAKTSPVKLVNHRLTVLVEDAAYSHHLKYFEQNILDLIASPEICGEGVVRQVVYKVGRLPNPNLIESKSLFKEQISEEPEIPEEVIKTAEHIEDRKLKSSFTRLMSKHLLRKSSQTE